MRYVAEAAGGVSANIFIKIAADLYVNEHENLCTQPKEGPEVRAENSNASVEPRGAALQRNTSVATVGEVDVPCFDSTHR